MSRYFKSQPISWVLHQSSLAYMITLFIPSLGENGQNVIISYITLRQNSWDETMVRLDRIPKLMFDEDWVWMYQAVMLDKLIVS